MNVPLTNFHLFYFTNLSALVIEIIHSLQGKGKLKLSQKFVLDMISPQGCSKWTGLGVFLDDSNEELQIYSLGWGVGFQCMMVCYPYCGNGAVIMTNSDLGVHQMEGIIGEVVKRYPYIDKEAVPSSFFIYITFFATIFICSGAIISVILS